MLTFFIDVRSTFAAALAVCLGLCFAGCFNTFPLQTDTDTSEGTGTFGDTSTVEETDSVVDTNTDSDTGAPWDTDTGDGSQPETVTGPDSGSATSSDSGKRCPEGIELREPIQFTEVSRANISATEYTDTCPSGQIIIGFQGFLREPGVDPMAHGRIRAICGAPSIRSAGETCIVEVSPADSLPVRGIAGDLEWSQTCPDNEVIVGFKAWTGNNIDCLAFRCVPLVIANDGGGYAIELGAHRDMEPVGNPEGGGVDFQHDCPDGQVATTTRLEADHFVRAVSFGCQAPSPTD